jgi:hypothetical protein
VVFMCVELFAFGFSNYERRGSVKLVIHNLWCFLFIPARLLVKLFCSVAFFFGGVCVCVCVASIY